MGREVGVDQVTQINFNSKQDDTVNIDYAIDTEYVVSQETNITEPEVCKFYLYHSS